jgi:hypothetical protein
MLERLSEAFYDPLVFWGVPLALALLREAIRRVRVRPGPRSARAGSS